MTSLISYHKINKKLASKGVTLVAVSKTQTDDSILELYKGGQKVFGENKVQELVPKSKRLPNDIEWHMIGHLQRNKVKQIVPFIKMIESVDSVRLLRQIDKEAGKIGRIIPCLIQMYIAEEESKFGLDEKEALELLEEYSSMKNLQIQGVMGMASFSENMELVKREFLHLKEMYLKFKDTYFKDNPEFNIISMGMSGDFELAIECGSNMVRLGSILFGSRK